jgi:transmembrane sensor
MKNDDLDQIEAAAADWIAERDRADGGLPPARQAALEAWLNASTAHRVAFLRLDHAWHRADRLRALQAAAPPAKAAPPAPVGRDWRARLPVRRMAAGLAAAALALVLGLHFGGGRSTQDYATERGQRESVTLGDGSRLTLNTATQLRTAVTPRSREVWLENGEAFFDIAHDASRPFVIHAGRQTVTVLGTKFSLYRDGDTLRVAVLEGRVQVQTGQARPAVLTRSDTALVDAGNLLVTRLSPQQLTASLGWLQGKLVFNEVSLEEAARQFNRYGSKQLVIRDAAAGRIVIGGVFEAGNVEAFARLLHAGFGLQVEVEGEQIRISSPAS